jgi:hypothetical protein
MRIAAGALIGLAELPIVFTWQRTRRPEYGTPILALRLRITAIVLHVVGAVLIIGTAISEIWFSVNTAGRWLFGIYGAAAAVCLLGVFAFYLAFIAELPPPPPKPVKKRKKKERKRPRRRRSGEDEADEDEDVTDEDQENESTEEEPADADEEAEEPATVTVEKADDADTVITKKPAEPTDEDDPATVEAPTPDAPTVEVETSDDTATAESPRNGIRNRRTTGKIRRTRRIRKSDGVAVED